MGQEVSKHFAIVQGSPFAFATDYNKKGFVFMTGKFHGGNDYNFGGSVVSVPGSLLQSCLMQGHIPPHDSLPCLRLCPFLALRLQLPTQFHGGGYYNLEESAWNKKKRIYMRWDPEYTKEVGIKRLDKNWKA